MISNQQISPEGIYAFMHTKFHSGNGSYSFELNQKKHSIVGRCNSERVFELRLPLQFPKINDDETVPDYLGRATTIKSTYCIILIQAGYCALGNFRNGDLIDHKALRTYMTRRKQGKNELTHRNSGSNARSAGSQLRYHNAIRLFEDINRKLNEWNELKDCERILYSCPVKLWQYVFASKVKSCFEKNDVRLTKIPLDVQTPDFREMVRIHNKVSKAYLKVFAEFAEFAESHSVYI